jgi:Flp pilus assembly pilin Flp
MQQWWTERMWRVTDILSRWVWTTDHSRAQSTVEYALVGALVVIVAAAALTTLGDQVNGVFANITKTLSAPR